jgi:CheY-like chemotaxis protein
VLVADDCPDTAASLAMMVRLWGHVCHLAHDGPEAVQKAMARPPDVALLDIGLPGLDGYQVARLLRRCPHTARALLVAVTGYGQEIDRWRGHEAGFDAFFVKPADPEDLARLLEIHAEIGPATD